mmetsp:Transcript_61752/g.152035  ORF Transcript_61752/g.152035 Transcript_61752/m.152035 type:complete len:119 (-) Transcript_61752:79-435(-)
MPKLEISSSFPFDVTPLLPFSGSPCPDILGCNPLACKGGLGARPRGIASPGLRGAGPGSTKASAARSARSSSILDIPAVEASRRRILGLPGVEAGCPVRNLLLPSGLPFQALRSTNFG